jgi:hypothetical protein
MNNDIIPILGLLLAILPTLGISALVLKQHGNLEVSLSPNGFQLKVDGRKNNTLPPVEPEI